MLLKDKVSISISVIAIVLSIGATIRGEFRASKDAEIAVRSQLTDVLKDLLSVNTELVEAQYKIFKDPKNETNSVANNYIQTITNISNQRNNFLLDQSMYLSSQVSELVTPVEYNTIAIAQTQAGNYFLAEQVYEKSITASEGGYQKALATRSMARFYFQQNRYEEGRTSYELSLKYLQNSDDRSNWTNGTTYLNWGVDERVLARSETRATQLFESAGSEFSQIDNEFLRNNNLAILNGVQSQQIPPNNQIQLTQKKVLTGHP